MVGKTTGKPLELPIPKKNSRSKAIPIPTVIALWPRGGVTYDLLTEEKKTQALFADGCA